MNKQLTATTSISIFLSPFNANRNHFIFVTREKCSEANQSVYFYHSFAYELHSWAWCRLRSSTTTSITSHHTVATALIPSHYRTKFSQSTLTLCIRSIFYFIFDSNAVCRLSCRVRTLQSNFSILKLCVKVSFVIDRETVWSNLIWKQHKNRWHSFPMKSPKLTYNTHINPLTRVASLQLNNPITNRERDKYAVEEAHYLLRDYGRLQTFSCQHSHQPIQMANTIDEKAWSFWCPEGRKLLHVIIKWIRIYTRKAPYSSLSHIINNDIYTDKRGT